MRSPRQTAYRYARVLSLRKEGKTFAEIAEELGVSRQRIWQIYSRAIKRPGLYRNMGNYGLTASRAL